MFVYHKITNKNGRLMQGIPTLFHKQDFHGLLGAQHLIFAQRSLYVYDFQIVRIYLELSAWIGRRKGNSQPLDYQMASFHTMKGAEKITPQPFLALPNCKVFAL